MRNLLISRSMFSCRTTGSSSTRSVVSSIPSEIQVIDLTDRHVSSTAPMTSKPRSDLFNVLLQRNWQIAIDMIEMEPNLAKEWHYGIDSECQDKIWNKQEQQQPILWKRLVLHVACSVTAPIELIQLLLQIYPEAITAPDPHTGSLPIHLACSTSSGRGSTCTGDGLLSSSPPSSSLSLPLIQELMVHAPGTTKAVDYRGRSPLHCAILSKASTPIVRFLVQHDRASVVCPDIYEKTPLEYAHRVYPDDNDVVPLLDTIVWI